MPSKIKRVTVERQYGVLTVTHVDDKGLVVFELVKKQERYTKIASLEHRLVVLLNNEESKVAVLQCPDNVLVEVIDLDQQDATLGETDSETDGLKGVINPDDLLGDGHQ